jgi:antitoxin VapB
MPKIEKARVFMNGRSQAVRIPVEYRFSTSEVYIRRDPQSGDLILSQAPGGWDEIYAALDRAGVPEDFLADRVQGLPQERTEW